MKFKRSGPNWWISPAERWHNGGIVLKWRHSWWHELNDERFVQILCNSIQQVVCNKNEPQNKHFINTMNLYTTLTLPQLWIHDWKLTCTSAIIEWSVSQSYLFFNAQATHESQKFYCILLVLLSLGRHSLHHKFLAFCWTGMNQRRTQQEYCSPSWLFIVSSFWLIVTSAVAVCLDIFVVIRTTACSFDW